MRKRKRNEGKRQNGREAARARAGERPKEATHTGQSPGNEEAMLCLQSKGDRGEGAELTGAKAMRAAVEKAAWNAGVRDGA